jgi:hypothetical protein
MKKNILEIYMNYLYAIRMHEEYGNLYGDTCDIIKCFEEEIKNELLSNDTYNKIKVNKIFKD